MSIKISVITPCYNDGRFLEDAVNSIGLNVHANDIEHIVVNDGSTDKETLLILDEIAKKNGVKVIHQSNKGLAAARNAGIKVARGSYILPLDADNKIEPLVFLEAMQIMQDKQAIDVVYTNALRFGIIENEWIVGSFDRGKLAYLNYIDACALIRKNSLTEAGMYNESMPFMGCEDWELWIKFALSGKQFYYLPKTGFSYRVRTESMLRSMNASEVVSIRSYLYLKYPDMLNDALIEFSKVEADLTRTKRWVDAKKRYLKKNKLKSAAKILLGTELL